MERNQFVRQESNSGHESGVNAKRFARAESNLGKMQICSKLWSGPKALLTVNRIEAAAIW
jgi:hypothetical protein